MSDQNPYDARFAPPPGAAAPQSTAPPQGNALPPYPPPFPPPVPPAGHPGYRAYPQYLGAPPPPRGRSTGAKVAIIASSVVGGLVVLAIGGGIAAAVYDDQHATSVARRTTITMPPLLEGNPRMTGAADLGVQTEAARVAKSMGTTQAAAYGTGAQVQVAVVAGVHPLTRLDQSDFLHGFDKGVTGAGASSPSAADPGPLGGQMRCVAALDGHSTICAFADSGAFGAITVLALGEQAHDLAVRIRSDIEHRS